MLKILTATILLVAAMASSIQADPLYDWRSTGMGLDVGIQATPLWSGNGDSGFQVSWDLNENQDGTWNYKYWITGDQGGSHSGDLATSAWTFLDKGLSNFTLEMTPGTGSTYEYLASSIWDTDGIFINSLEPTTQIGPYPNTATGQTVEYGIKWDGFAGDVGAFYIEFNHGNKPIYGDFIAKDGVYDQSQVLAFNEGLNTDPTLDTVLNYIAIPDGVGGIDVNPVPEPSTFISMIGLFGCLSLGIAYRRHRSQ